MCRVLCGDVRKLPGCGLWYSDRNGAAIFAMSCDGVQGSRKFFRVHHTLTDGGVIEIATGLYREGAGCVGWPCRRFPESMRSV